MKIVGFGGKLTVLIFLFACFVQVPTGLAQQGEKLALLEKSFFNPPDDCRIMMRWWWFGPAVTKSELKLELEQMKAEGIGGVEIATLYPLALDDPKTNFKNLKYLSDEHLDALRFAVAEAAKLGLRVDVTLGTGWPLGGPHISVDHAAGELRVETVPLPTGTGSVALPDVSAGEKLIATFLVPLENGLASLPEARQIPTVIDGRLEISPPLSAPTNAMFFISSRTGMMVKRAATGGEGFVLDHYDRAAAEAHLQAVGDRLLEAFGEKRPYAIFSDSLEDDGSDWTGDLIEEFRARRGYDLTSYLPALVGDIGPMTGDVRHDWGKTLTELANERFLAPLHDWARQHHTLLRSQTYGTPPVTLSSNRYADLPEGEAKASLLMWREFSDTRWAASAGHLFGNPVISSETWTWLHSPAFRATPLDLKAEADAHFLQGINQLVGHGWPYSPPEAGEPGWRMYAASALNAHNPWSFVMPELDLYLQRVSFALRQGKPANDVALLLPNDDIWSTFSVRKESDKSVVTPAGFNTAGANLSMDDPLNGSLLSKLIPQVLDAGFNFDFIDADAIATVGIPYKVLILPAIDRLPLETYRKIEEYARHGGILVAAHSLPSIAPGLLQEKLEGPQIREISEHLFRADHPPGHFIPDETQVGSALATYLAPDVVFLPKTPRIGFIHRKLASGDLYFIVNTTNRSQHVETTFRHSAKYAQVWDAFTGRVTATALSSSLHLDLQPYESRLVLLTDATLHGEKPAQTEPSSETKTIELKKDWEVSIGDSNEIIPMAELHSWSEEPASKYYSGRAIYQRTFNLPAKELGTGIDGVLDFGPGKIIEEPNPLPDHSMKAYLEGPVCEAAQVYVNGVSAGFVWHPPYSLDITTLLKPGVNALKIVVGNTAINSLAGRALPTYRLLNQRYGERFTPQDMGYLESLPSGILGDLQLKLVQRPPAKP
jgi:alpha-L-rhamnosidase